MDSYQTGLFAEFIAKMFLRLHGYKIIRGRYTTGKYTGRAEIDIIAKRKDTIVFCEVKKRHDFITGIESVTPKQQQRLRAAAETYILRHRWTKFARFDVIVIGGRKIYWIKNAF